MLVLDVLDLWNLKPSIWLMYIETRTKYEMINLWFVSKYVGHYPYFLDSFCLVNRKTRCHVNLNNIYIKKITTLNPNNTWKHILFFLKKNSKLDNHSYWAKQYDPY
jgi:hypothetical protein